MAIQPFLAMTAAEMRNCSAFPRNTAWLACHFSPYGTGLSNLPQSLPAGSLLVVDDITPMHGHDPVRIASQLLQSIQSLECSGVLLDFQRPGNDEAFALVRSLSSALSCPLAVSEFYAEDGSFPVFLSPVPPSVPLQEHVEPWKGREIWLDLGCLGEMLQLSEDGCGSAPFPISGTPEAGFADKELCCHYRICKDETGVQFTLWRTWEDVLRLLEEAESLGATAAVGLYQELHPIYNT